MIQLESEIIFKFLVNQYFYLLDRFRYVGRGDLFIHHSDKSFLLLLLTSTSGFLAPLAQLIDARTGGWGLSYADTSPYSDKTIVGLLFLATNFFFVWAGINLFHANNYVLSASIEVSGLASFYYHWCQIHYGPKRDEVRVSLLIDYITAFITINLTFFEIVLLAMRIFDSTDQTFLLASEPILYGVLGIFCLLGSWAFEYGLPYIILHGFWHIFSAISASSLTH